MPENRIELQQTQKLSQSLQTALHLLCADLDALADSMQQAIQENPALEYVPPQKSPQDYAMHVRAHYRAGRGEAPGVELAAAADTAMDELEQQLRLSSLPEATARAARQMLHMLSPRGFFPETLEAFSAESGVPIETARRALEAVQALEPAGIGARTLEECLELQLRNRPDADPLCRVLIREHLQDIAKGCLRQIVRQTGASAAHVQQCVETIRSLSPAPCSLYEDAVQYIMPEFSVEVMDNGELAILFHNDYYPTLRPDDNFRRLAQTLTGEELAFARRMQSSAHQLLQAIEMRQATMEKVAQIIVREQRSFFLGEYSLVPLRIEDAAKEIGVHETTVYRALQNKYLYCRRGTFPLAHFFQKEISGGASTARVKEIIRDICRENGRMSDREITQALADRGIVLSRRTVAKYRATMDIDSSFRRRAKETDKRSNL